MRFVWGYLLANQIRPTFLEALYDETTHFHHQNNSNTQEQIQFQSKANNNKIFF